MRAAALPSRTTQKVAVIDVLAQWMNEMGREEIGEA
jgi:hypothetical protein